MAEEERKDPVSKGEELKQYTEEVNRVYNKEQEEIVNHIDRTLRKYNTLIAKKTALLTELETYKKSLIYEYVTGKKEVI